MPFPRSIWAHFDRNQSLIGVGNCGKDSSQKPEERRFGIVAVPPFRNEFAGNKGSIDKSHRKNPDLQAGSPALSFPDDMEPQNILPEAIVTVNPPHMVVCGDYFGAGYIDPVVAAI